MTGAAAGPSWSVRHGNTGSIVVASVPLPGDLALPPELREDVLERAGHDDPEVVVSHRDVPFAEVLNPHEPEWIACWEARPHRDPYFRDDIFLTLVVDTHRGHEVGDALGQHTLQHVKRGDLFVLDPLVPHWPLGPSDEKAVWAAIQWTVGRDVAQAACRELVERLGGHWYSGPVDPRYAGWQPKGLPRRTTIVLEGDMPSEPQPIETMVPEGEGWVRWGGGQDAPAEAVAASREGDVDLAYRDGTRGTRRDQPGAMPIVGLRWTHEGWGDDIVAWRKRRLFVGDLAPVFRRDGTVLLEGLPIGHHERQEDGRHAFHPSGDGTADTITVVRPRRADLTDAIRAHAAASVPTRFTTRWEPRA